MLGLIATTRWNRGENMSKLYHYTTLNGLMGILERKQLWVTNKLSVNDKTEFIHSKPLFTKIIERGAKLKAKSNISHSTLIHCCKSLADIVIKALGDAYIFSTCTHKDKFEEENGILSMWRAYGKENGCAIGFNKEKLEELFGREQALAIVHGKVYYGVADKKMLKYFDTEEKYDGKTHQQMIEDFTDKVLIPICREMIKPPDQRENIEAEKNHVRACLNIIPRLKHLGFKEEQEYRFAILKNHKDKNAKIKTRILNGKYVEYYELDFQNDITLIEDIIIAPGDTNINQLKENIKRLGFDIPIRKSMIPITGV